MRRSSAFVFGAAFVAYLAIGLWLSVGHGFIVGDALSRVAAARAVVLSRDPHLAAIGFVFTPLTSLVQIPVVALSGWWPALTRWAVSGVLMSSLFMAGAVLQVRGISLDRGLSARFTAVVTALFAVTPVIVFYGANGMSEAPFVFFVCWAMRRLIRWTTTDDVADLIVVGSALGLGYLVRYDAIVATATVSVFVGALTASRHPGPLRDRLSAARLDILIVAGPAMFAFAFWALVGWLLTGEAFAQFTSVYGNAAILASSGGSVHSPIAGLMFAVTECAILAPGLLLIVPAGLALGFRRRELESAVPVIICAPVIGFQAVLFIAGSTFGLLRFYISVVPWLVVAVILLAERTIESPSRRPGAFASSHVLPVRPGPLPRVGVALLALGVVVGGWGMAQPDLAPQEYALGAVLAPNTDRDDVVASDRRLAIAATFSTERNVADYLDSLHLPNGSVLIDSVYGFAVTAASSHPLQFVIPSDRDFVTILNDPDKAGVQYLLTVPPSGRGTSDALNRRYPSIYADGAGVAQIDVQAPNDGADQPLWRLYRLLPPRK